MDDKLFEKYRIYLEQLFGQPVSSSKIKAITVNPPYARQDKRRLQVGKSYSDLEPGAELQKILAIFESKSFLIVTASRGAGTGMPFIFPLATVLKVENETGSPDNQG